MVDFDTFFLFLGGIMWSWIVITHVHFYLAYGRRDGKRWD
jgi:hypothetical protein